MTNSKIKSLTSPFLNAATLKPCFLRKQPNFSLHVLCLDCADGLEFMKCAFWTVSFSSRLFGGVKALLSILLRRVALHNLSSLSGDDCILKTEWNLSNYLASTTPSAVCEWQMKQWLMWISCIKMLLQIIFSNFPRVSEQRLVNWKTKAEYGW